MTFINFKKFANQMQLYTSSVFTLFNIIPISLDLQPGVALVIHKVLKSIVGFL